MELLNMIEEKWFSEKAFDDQMIMCDQLAMAVFIKPEIASKTEIFHVSFKLCILFEIV